jgi:transcriptional regulator with XRE-family HTH domain
MPRPSAARGPAEVVGVHIGARIRLRRTVLGMSQERLGELSEVSFQQVQKYERGTSRMNAVRLCELSRALDVPVTYFVEGLLSPPTASGAFAPPLGTEAQAIAQELLREATALLRAYASAEERRQRQIHEILDFAKPFTNSGRRRRKRSDNS